MPASTVQDSMIIEGIIFSVVHEGKWVGLVCDEWPSLASHGESLEEARAMMCEVIADARRVFLAKPLIEQSNESKRFADFLQRKTLV